MWGIIPAAGNGTRIQPLAFSKELLPVGSRFEDGTERPRAVSEYLIERMLQGGADKICFVISRWKFDILQYYGGEIGDGRASPMWCSPSRAGCATRSFAPLPFVDPAEPVLVGLPDTIWLPEDALRAAPRRPARLPDVPGRRGRNCSTPWSATTTGGCAKSRSSSAGARLELGLGRLPHAGRGAARAAPLCGARATRRDEYFGTLVNAWLAEGGEAVAVPAGTRLCRCRHAGRLSRGDAAAGRGGAVARDAARRAAAVRGRDER